VSFSLPVCNGQTRISKQALQYKFKGKRNIGSPPKRWRDQLHLDGQGTGTVPDASEIMMVMYHDGDDDDGNDDEGGSYRGLI